MKILKRDLINLKIKELEEELAETPWDSERFELLTERLEKLNHVKNSRKNKVSADTKAVVVANLAGVAFVVFADKAWVLSKTALGMVIKGRA